MVQHPLALTDVVKSICRSRVLLGAFAGIGLFGALAACSRKSNTKPGGQESAGLLNPSTPVANTVAETVPALQTEGLFTPAQDKQISEGTLPEGTVVDVDGRVRFALMLRDISNASKNLTVLEESLHKAAPQLEVLSRHAQFGILIVRLEKQNLATFTSSAEFAAIRTLAKASLNRANFDLPNASQWRTFSERFSGEAGASSVGASSTSQTASRYLGVEELLTELTKMGVSTSFLNESDTLVGVVDTGTSFLPAFGNRLMGVADVTSEGRANFFKVLSAEKNPQGITTLEMQNSSHQNGKVKSRFPVVAADEVIEKLKSGELKIAIVSERSYAANEIADINGNGSSEENFPVLMRKSADGRSEFWMSKAAMEAGRPLALNPDSWIPEYQTEADLFDIQPGVKVGFKSTQGLRFPDRVVGNDFERAQAGREEYSAVQLIGLDAGIHGTHVSGIIGARCLFSNRCPSGNELPAIDHRGVHPGVKLYGVKALAGGSGDDLSILEGVLHAVEKGAKIVNLSLGGTPLVNDGFDLWAAAITRVTRQGNVLFVVAAGNDGVGQHTVASPGAADDALTVGASSTAAQLQSVGRLNIPVRTVSDEPFPLFFSSRGPTNNMNHKPDVMAPGWVRSTAPLAKQKDGSAGTVVMPGTSMATPAVAGAAALLMDAAKSYNEMQRGKGQTSGFLPTDAISIREALKRSATLIGHDVQEPSKFRSDSIPFLDQGHGQVNLLRAFRYLQKIAPMPLVPFDVKVETKLVRNGVSYGGVANPYAVSQGYKDELLGRGIFLTLNGNDEAYVVDPYSGKKLSEPRLFDVKLDLRAPAFLGNKAIEYRTAEWSYRHSTEYVSADGKRTLSPAWIKPVSLSLDPTCQSALPNPFTVYGEGRTDTEAGFKICVDREGMKAAVGGVPGIHVVTIKGHLAENGMAPGDETTDFVVPVYIYVTKNKIVAENEEVLAWEAKRYLFQNTSPYGLLRTSLRLQDRSRLSDPCTQVKVDVTGEGMTKQAWFMQDQAAAGFGASCFDDGNTVKYISPASTELRRPGYFSLSVLGFGAVPVGKYSIESELVSFDTGAVPVLVQQGKAAPLLKDSVLTSSLVVRNPMGIEVAGINTPDGLQFKPKLEGFERTLNGTLPDWTFLKTDLPIKNPTTGSEVWSALPDLKDSLMELELTVESADRELDLIVQVPGAIEGQWFDLYSTMDSVNGGIGARKKTLVYGFTNNPNRKYRVVLREQARLPWTQPTPETKYTVIERYLMVPGAQWSEAPTNRDGQKAFPAAESVEINSALTVGESYFKQSLVQNIEKWEKVFKVLNSAPKAEGFVAKPLRLSGTLWLNACFISDKVTGISGEPSCYTAGAQRFIYELK